MTLFANAEGKIGGERIGTLYMESRDGPYVFCKEQAGVVSNPNDPSEYNHWWLWTDLDDPAGSQGWVSAYYLKGQGSDVANDNAGEDIPDCW